VDASASHRHGVLFSGRLTVLANLLSHPVVHRIALVFGGLMIAAGTVLGPHRPDSEKLSRTNAIEAFEDARMKFDVRYYLVAILFFCSIWKSRFSSPGR